MTIQLPTSPSIVEIGGMHINAPKPLPEDLKQFMDDAPNGVVYFSLGSVIQGESLQDGVVKAMVKTFGKLKMKVLWKWNEHIEGLPSNVKIGKWFPQQDILS